MPDASESSLDRSYTRLFASWMRPMTRSSPLAPVV
jgi:hypothetical protein